MRSLCSAIIHTKSNHAIFSAFVFVASFLAIGLASLIVAPNASANASPDNDIVRGGIWNRDLASKCTGDVKTIMDHYRIDCNLSGVVDGKACRDGKVYVGDRVVAHNAQSIGRLAIQGNHEISIGGKTYYETPNSQAFLSECLDTFVKLDSNGSFVYAIIKACGNPIWTPNPVVVTPQEQPKDISVCDLTSKKIVSIKENEYDSNKHSKNLDDCKEVVKQMTVCEMASKDIVVINENEYDVSKHTINLSACNEEEKCVYDSTLPADSPKCVAPVASTPAEPELPKTGVSGGLMGAGFGIGSMLVAGSAYVGSRRSLFDAFLNR